MRSPHFQILDLREPQIKVAWSNATSVEVGGAVDLAPSGCAETDWLHAVDGALEHIPLQRHRTLLILPLRVLLFKIVRLPDVKGNKLRNLLGFEVERAFPHDPENLVWGHHRIWRDEFECEVLLAAMHRKTLESLSTTLEHMGVPTVFAIPSPFIAVEARTDFDASLGVHHCICLEESQGCVVSRWNAGSHVTTFSLRQPAALPSVQQCREGRAILLEKALKKAAAALHRKAGLLDSGCFEWSGTARDAESRSRFESIAKLAFRASHCAQHRWIDVSLQGLSSLLESRDTSEMLNVPALQGADRQSAWQRSVQIAAVMLMALAPLFWAIGNERAIGQYRAALVENRQRMDAHRVLTEVGAARLESFETVLEACEVVERDCQRQDALLQLLEDLQQAMLRVGDTWFEALELVVSRVEGEQAEPLLTLEGKFLLRQSRLGDEQWQSAIADAESNLQRLQQEVLASSFVDSIEQFSVSFGGIHQRIPVVPFKLRVVLAQPFGSRPVPAMEVAR